MGRATSRTTGRATSRTTDRATRRAAGPRYAPGRRAALRVGPPGCAMHRTAGRAARRTNYSVTAPLDLRTKGRRTPIHTYGHRGPAPLESTAGFMYRTLGLRLGVGLGLLESTTHRWTGQLGPRHLPAPARTYSHHWRGTCRGREDQRGPTRDGTGRRRRLRRAEPGRAGT